MSKVKSIFLTAGVCVAIAFICLFGYLCLQNMCAEIFILIGWETRSSVELFTYGFWVALLLYAVFPPLLEELIFRFAVCKTLQWTKLRPWLIVGISAVLFMLYHRSWSQLVYQLIMGIFFAWIFLKTNNLVWTILIHFINNAFIVTYTYFTEGSGDAVFALSAGNIILAIGSALVATVAVTLLIKKGIPHATK